MRALKQKIATNSRLRFFMRKLTGFMWLQRALGTYTVRPYISTDLRLFRILYCLEQTRHLPEPVAEFGIGSGYGMTYMLTAMRDLCDRRSYHGFDTFGGFPYIHEEDLEGIPDDRKVVSTVGRYGGFGIEAIRRQARAAKMEHRTTFHQGAFEETLPRLSSDQRFSFVFIDCDLYQSYLTSLAHLYDRVVDGGIFLFDEYEHTVEWPGARKAIDEFFADKIEKPEPLPFGTSWIAVKGKAAQAVGSEPVRQRA